MWPRCLTSIVALFVLVLSLFGPACAEIVELVLFVSMCEEDQPDCYDIAGASLNVTAQLMRERINRAGFLGAHSLQLRIVDTYCSPVAGLQETARLLVGLSNRPFGVCGCSCSSCTINAARMLHVARIPLVSPTASSAELSDRDQFPHFFRVFSPDTVQITAWFHIFRAFGWRRFGAFHDQDHGSRMMGRYLSILADFPDMEDRFRNSAFSQLQVANADDAQSVVDLIVASKVRGVMTSALLSSVRWVVCLLTRSGVHGVVLTYYSWYAEAWWLASLPCTAEQMVHATEYSITAGPPSWHTDEERAAPCDPSISVREFREENARRLASLGGVAAGYEQRMETSYMADTICMLALLFRNMSESRTFQQLLEMDHATFEAASAQMQLMRFEGLSGPISFAANRTAPGAGDRLAVLQLRQRRGGTMGHVGELSSGAIVFRPTFEFAFDDGFTIQNLPPDLFPGGAHGEVYNFQQAACIPCALGRIFVEERGACECQPGRWMSQASADCALCTPGSFSGEPGLQSCELCAAGSFAAAEGQSACLHCEAGHFANASGAVVCHFCPGSLTTPFLASTSEADCACAAGSFLNMERTVCKPCPEGMECVFGADLLDRDARPRLLPGFMSLPDQYGPLSVFTCVNGEHRCPGRRQSCLERETCGGMCEPEFRLSPRCGECASGYYTIAGGCQMCSGLDAGSSGFFMLVLMLAVQTVMLCWMYKRWNRPNPSGMITIASAVNFVQVVQALSRLPLEWPEVMRSVFSVLDHFQAPAIFQIFSVRLQCLLDTGSYWPLLMRDLLMPLTIILLFGLIAAVCRAIGRPVNPNWVFNVVGKIFGGLFISILGLTLQLFVTEPMPNGHWMVKTLPSIEMGSEQWVRVLPVCLVACLAYCITYVAVVARAVFLAPWLAASMPGFTERYRFAFGATRPDRWWWVLVGIVYQMSLLFVQISARNVIARLYGSILVTIIVTIVQFNFLPFKFLRNNFVDLTFKCALIVFLVIATLFIGEEWGGNSFSAEKNQFGIIAVIVLASAILYAMWQVIAWGLSLFQADGVQSGAACRLAIRFRDLTTSLGLMTNKEFLRRVGKLAEADLKRLSELICAIVEIFFGMQPSTALRHQRVMPGISFKVWDPRETMLQSLEIIQSGQLQTAFETHYSDRVRVMEFVKVLREVSRKYKSSLKSRIEKTNSDFIPPAWTSRSIWNTSKDVALDIASILHPDKHAEMTAAELTDKLLPFMNGLEVEVVDRIVKLTDLDGNGTVSMHEFVTTLIAMAPDLWENPRLMDRYSAVTRQIASKDESIARFLEVVDRALQPPDQHSTACTDDGREEVSPPVPPLIDKASLPARVAPEALALNPLVTHM